MKAKDTALLEKIRKLLAMTVANGCTEAEAASALGLVNRLMEEHAIGMDEVQGEREDPEERITDEEVDPGLSFGTAQAWTTPLAIAVAELWGVYPLRKPSPAFGSVGVKFIFVGAPVDVAAAKVCFLWLVEQGKRLCEARFAEHGTPGGANSFRASYLKGFMQGIVTQVVAILKDRDTAKARYGSPSTPLTSPRWQR